MAGQTGPGDDLQRTLLVGEIQRLDRETPPASVDETFEMFYRHEFTPAARLAGLLTRSSVVAEDLAQEAFVSLQRVDCDPQVRILSVAMVKTGWEPNGVLGIHVTVRDRAALTSTGVAPPFAEVDFSAFYQREYPHVVRLAWLLVRSSAVAEDLAQEAFIALARKYEQVDNPAGFVHRVVVNQARTWHRNERRNAVKVHRAATDGVAALPPGDADLFDLVGALPYRQRAVVVLRYGHGWSETEIADVLGCRPGTVKSLASRALHRLREEIQHDLND
jgi:RNA polymerase sigma factor (sigma-70 family)